MEAHFCLRSWRPAAVGGSLIGSHRGKQPFVYNLQNPTRIQKSFRRTITLPGKPTLFAESK
eukprot:7451113-Pyramimonas_sp.AAC.1